MLKRYCFIDKTFDNQICSTGFCVLRANPLKVLPKWIYYNVSTSDFYNHISVFEKGTSYPAISDRDVKNYKIPLPPLEVQEHVVSILDKFDYLLNDISEGLPKEIELRGKQYKYYRDRLLSFEK